MAAGPDVSLFSVMRAGAYTQNALHALGMAAHPAMPPVEWLRLGTLGGAAALGLEDQIGSVEAGKEADLIVVDPATTLPLGDAGPGPARRSGRDPQPADLPHPAGHGARRLGARAAAARLSRRASATLRADGRVIQLLVNAGALYVAVLITEMDWTGAEWWKFLLVALAFSLLNTYIQPILRILTLPITVVTLGLFLLVINAVMLLLTSAVSDQLASASMSTASCRHSWARSWSRSSAGACR